MLADFDSCQVGHNPIDNYKSWMMLREKVDRFAPAFGENQGVPFFTQRLLDELAGNSRIVGHQDPNLLLASLQLVHSKRSRLPVCVDFSSYLAPALIDRQSAYSRD